LALKIALPNKGRLREPALKLLGKAGIECLESERGYFCETTDPSVKVIFVRARDVPSYVYYGAADLGITGHDIVAESGFEVYEVLDLKFGECKLVVAAPLNSHFHEVSDIPSGVRVATEFPNITRRFFDELGKQVQIVYLHGAVEAAPALGMADVIVDVMETGKTLERNRLRVLGVILKSTARLVCNRVSYRLKLDEVMNLVTKVKAAMR